MFVASWAAPATDDVQITGTAGLNNVQEVNACCYSAAEEDLCDGHCKDCFLTTANCDGCCFEDPPPMGCDDCEGCEEQNCLNLSGDPEWEPGPPEAGQFCCDDEPKNQREPSITAAWWDPDVLLSVFIDLGTTLSFAVSNDGGDTWSRLARDNEFWPDPCDPPAAAFVPGYARNVLDICEGGTLAGRGSSDPWTATGWDATPENEKGYVYFVGVNSYFARLALDPETRAPLGPWQVSLIPPGDASETPFIASEPWGESLYVIYSDLGPGSEYQTYLTVSCDNGSEFFSMTALFGLKFLEGSNRWVF